jgi:hypothetical protein
MGPTDDAQGAALQSAHTLSATTAVSSVGALSMTMTSQGNPAGVRCPCRCRRASGSRALLLKQGMQMETLVHLGTACTNS